MSTETQIKAQIVTLPRVNLMPPEIAERKRLSQIKAGLALVVVVALGAVALLYQHGQGSVSAANDTLVEANAQQGVLRGQLADLAATKTLAQSLATRETMLSLAKGSEVRWSSYLTDLSLTIPKNVWLTNLTISQATQVVQPGVARPDGRIGDVSFTGTARSHDDVAAWLDSLATQVGYSHPYFSSSTEKYLGPEKVTDFTSTVDLTADALSGRCDKSGVC